MKNCVRGRSSNFVHPADHASTIAIAESLSTAANAVISFENRYLCKDGSYKWLAWDVTPFAEQQLLYAVARDITQSTQAHEEVQKAKKRRRGRYSSEE